MDCFFIPNLDFVINNCLRILIWSFISCLSSTIKHHKVATLVILYYQVAAPLRRCNFLGANHTYPATYCSQWVRKIEKSPSISRKVKSTTSLSTQQMAWLVQIVPLLFLRPSKWRQLRGPLCNYMHQQCYKCLISDKNLENDVANLPYRIIKLLKLFTQN